MATTSRHAAIETRASRLIARWGSTPYHKIPREVRGFLAFAALIELFADMRGLTVWEATLAAESEQGCEVARLLLELKTELPADIWGQDIAVFVTRLLTAAERMEV
jgi:hypothetical protein